MKQLLIGAVFGIVAAILAIYLYSAARSRALADLDRDLATRDQVIADSIDRLLQSRMVETFTFAALPSLRAFAASDQDAQPARLPIAQSELQSIVASDPAVRATSITDKAGRVILTTDDSMGADWSKRAFVQEGLLGHLHASVPMRDSDEFSQYYSAPILDNAGNVAGVLAVRVAAQEFWDSFRSVPSVLVVDASGVRIADSGIAPQVFTAIAPLTNDVIERALETQRYGADITTINLAPMPALANAIKNHSASASFSDASRVAFRAAVRQLGTNPWSVVVLEREDDRLTTASVTFWLAAGFGIVVGLAIGFLAFRLERNQA